jgi:hypothetical protein
MTEPTDQKPPETGLAVELWPLDRLPPYENNARTHSPEQVAQLAASILEFGFTNPILADEKGVIAADFDLGLLGFDSERIAGLLDPEGIDGEGAPPTGADGPGKDYQQKYVVAVECSSEAEQETVYERLNGQGYACRLLRV